VRYWIDMPGQHQRAHKRERIRPVNGAGSLSESARKRRAREIIAASGADTPEFFEKVVLSQTGITFKEQAEIWYRAMETRRSGKNGRPTSPASLETWRGILDNYLIPELGNLQLASLMEDQTPVKSLVDKLVADGLSAKTISNFLQLVKMVVASAKEKHKQLFPVPWDREFIDAPPVVKIGNSSTCRTPDFAGQYWTEQKVVKVGSQSIHAKQRANLGPMANFMHQDVDNELSGRGPH